MMRKLLAVTVVSATLVALSSAVTAPAQAQWHRGYAGYGGYHGGYGGYRGGYGYGYRRGIGPGAVVGGALLGLGVGALLAAPYVAPPPVVYAPPPVYYPPPAYAYAPPPPPAYYPPY